MDAADLRHGADAAPHRRGTAVLLAAAGFAILSLGDATVKSMSGEWPAPAVGALRYSIGAVALGAIVAVRGGRAAFRFPHPLLQLGRGAAVSLATICFFIAAMNMPLADATAIQFTSPVLTVLLSMAVLRERPPRALWLAIAAASIGVLLIVRPNFFALGPVALYPLGTALGMAVLIILNRKGAGLAPALTMQFLIAVMAAPLLVVSAVALALLDPAQFAPAAPTWSIIGRCAVVAITGTVGHLLIFCATEQASASAVAPITYVQLLVATLIGWFWFGDVATIYTIAGAALIIAGSVLVWRSAK